MNNEGNIIKPFSIEPGFQTSLNVQGMTQEPPVNQVSRNQSADEYNSDNAGWYSNINPYTGYPVNMTLADRYYLEGLAKQQDFNNKVMLENLKSENQMRIEDKKHDNIKKRIEGMQDRMEERENATCAIFKDSDGRLCIETKFPTRSPKYSPPILKCYNLRAYKIFDVETHELVAVIVMADNMSENIILGKDEVNPKGLADGLTKRGVAVTIGRDRKKQTLELLFSYLIEEADVIELPTRLGWSKTRDGWVFVSAIEETIQGVIGGSYDFKRKKQIG